MIARISSCPAPQFLYNHPSLAIGVNWSQSLYEYLTEINKAYARGDSTEHTHRPALKTLVETLGDKITATNQPPYQMVLLDLVISRSLRKLDQNIGYIETKDITPTRTRSPKPTR